MFLTQQQEEPRIKFQLAVTLKSNRQLIGTCGIRLKSANAHEGDIGYELSPKQWGHGYATEAARSIVVFGFVQLKLHRISSWCMAENVGSAHVLQKLGMQPEGRLRQNEYFKGRWWDTLLFGILACEWEPRQHATQDWHSRRIRWIIAHIDEALWKGKSCPEHAISASHLRAKPVR